MEERYSNYVFSCYPSDSWASKVAMEIEKHIDIILKDNMECSIMLTGGNTIKLLYEYWRTNPISNFDKLRFYFGDERFVDPEDYESNYGLAKRSFFIDKQRLTKVFPMFDGKVDMNSAVQDYENILPTEIDLLFLGLGTDGHIASIFPHSGLTHRSNRKISSSISPDWPNERITITADVIFNAKFVFLFAIGAEKGKVLAKALYEPLKTEEMPVRMTIGRHWLMDETACTEFKNIMGTS